MVETVHLPAQRARLEGGAHTVGSTTMKVLPNRSPFRALNPGRPGRQERKDVGER